MARRDEVLERIEAFNRACGGGVLVHRAARGYSLYAAATGGPIARLKLTGDGDKVQVLAWRSERWGASGPFGVATMPLDRALDHIAEDPFFWIYA